MIMHCPFIHTFSFPLWYNLLMVLSASLSFSLSLSLSLSLFLSRIVCAWHPTTKLLHTGTLFISGHHLLIPLLYMSDSMMRKPVRTSRRTSTNVAFIWNAMLSYQTSPILLYRLSYIGRVGNLFERYP